MFETVKGWVAKMGGEEKPDDERHARLCATALLVEAALADGIYADIEEKRICAIVRETFGLDEEACAALIDEAEGLAEQAVDNHRFTNVVKSLPMDQRVGLIEGLWKVVFADGEESPFEDAFVRHVASLLYVEERDSRLARQRARDAAGGV